MHNQAAAEKKKAHQTQTNPFSFSIEVKILKVGIKIIPEIITTKLIEKIAEK